MAASAQAGRWPLPARTSSCFAAHFRRAGQPIQARWQLLCVATEFTHRYLAELNEDDENVQRNRLIELWAPDATYVGSSRSNTVRECQKQAFTSSAGRRLGRQTRPGLREAPKPAAPATS